MRADTAAIDLQSYSLSDLTQPRSNDSNQLHSSSEDCDSVTPQRLVTANTSSFARQCSLLAELIKEKEKIETRLEKQKSSDHTVSTVGKV